MKTVLQWQRNSKTVSSRECSFEQDGLKCYIWIALCEDLLYGTVDHIPHWDRIMCIPTVCTLVLISFLSSVLLFINL